MSSMRRLWKHLLSCGWQKSFVRDGGAEPTSKPTLSFAALPTSVVSQLNCCNMFSLAPALKTTQELRQMQNAAPDPRPRVGVSWSQACPVVSWRRVPAQVSSKQVEPRTCWGGWGEWLQKLGGTQTVAVPMDGGPSPPPGIDRGVWVPGNPNGPHFMQLVPFCRPG